jgi:hypothetical protein
MEQRDLSSVVSLIGHIATREFGITVDSAEAEQMLRAILFEPRNLWRIAHAGLVTNNEAANVVAGHVQTWLMNQTGQWRDVDLAKWESFVKDVEALFSAPPL